MQKILNTILYEALKSHATKVHFEPDSHQTLVRFRVDNTLHDYKNLTPDEYNQVLDQIQDVADIDEIDGPPTFSSFEFASEHFKGPIFVSVIPTSSNHSLCLSVMCHNPIDFDLDTLGLEQNSLKLLRESMHANKPSLISVSGPMNSGKCTTIYSALLEMRNKNLAVATAEVVRRAELQGVHQVIEDIGSGMNYSSIMRSFLQSDIDVMFIRELNDFETADTAFKSVLLNNKFVFTGMHCHDAIHTIERFQWMGIDPWLIAEAFSIIQGQRLLRRLCDKCKEKVVPDKAFFLSKGLSETQVDYSKIYRHKGCIECGGTGYIGMVLVAETLQMNDDFSRAILGQADRKELKRIATESGMSTLRQSGMRIMSEGLTCMNEVLMRTPVDY